ncbi:MAG: dynamin family protein [Chloroflexota bacterium]
MINAKPSLLTRYESLRRMEFEQLTALLDTLGKIDGLPADQMDQARDALFHADHPYLLVLVGAFNTGKSSLINALIGEKVLEVGATPTTSKIAILRYGPALDRLQSGEVETIFYPAPLLQEVSLVDTPGLDSVFKLHDEITGRFLHRADIVLLVMLATQAMSASTVEYLQSLRAYGKRVIVVVNQVDTLEPDEQKTMRDFVTDQSKQNLGFAPQVWLLSSRQATEAQQVTPRDEALWKASGFDQLEKFIEDALSDAARVRQKLETPLQISRNVITVARGLVREQQNALADYRRSVQNVKGQMETATNEQKVALQETLDQVNKTFAESIRRGREALQEMFQLSRALAMVAAGVMEFLGLAGIVRRLGANTPARAAFESHKVNEPLDELPAVIDRLGPRLEGRDVKDIDDLIAYTRREIERLPEALQTKIVGKLEAPAVYDRSIMRGAREDTLVILDKARNIEFKRIDQAIRNWLILVGAYQGIILIAGMIAALANNGNWLLLLAIVVILGLVGVGLIPLRGRLMEQAYGRRMLGFEDELEQAIDRAAQQQIATGTRLRNDAVGPFMRLVETQFAQVDQLKADLEIHEQKLVDLEKELGNLRD